MWFLLVFLSVFGCRRAAEAPLFGTVLSPNGQGTTDVVPGASVRIVTEGHQQEVEADELGRFVFPAVPVGEPLALVVEGPRRLDPDASEHFGARPLTVTVPDADGAVVYPHLRRGCTDAVSAGGGDVGADRCAGAGGVQIAFDGAGFVYDDGTSVTGAVDVELAVVDPRQPADLLGLPDDGLGLEGPPVLGAAQVVLRETSSGRAVEPAASATLTLEIADLPEGVAATDLVLEYWDESAGVYGEARSVDVVTAGGRTWAVVEAPHFSVVRVRGRSGDLGPSACVAVRAERCPPGGPCEGVTAEYAVVDLSRRRTYVPDLARAPGGATCLELAPSTQNLVFVRWANPLATALFEQPVYETAFRITAPPTMGRPPQRDDDCATYPPGGGSLQLQPLQFGCVNGTFRSAGGDPLVGPVRILLDGAHVSSAILPGPGVCSPDCAGQMCVKVPLPVSTTQEVEIQGSAGGGGPGTPRGRRERCGTPPTCPPVMRWHPGSARGGERGCGRRR